MSESVYEKIIKTLKGAAIFVFVAGIILTVLAVLYCGVYLFQGAGPSFHLSDVGPLAAVIVILGTIVLFGTAVLTGMGITGLFEMGILITFLVIRWIYRRSAS